MESLLSYEGPTFQNQGIFPARLYLWNKVGDPQLFCILDIINLLSDRS